jgi:hypothetical protein
MHTMNFRVPAGVSETLAPDLLASSIGGGHDRAPTHTQSRLDGDLLRLSRELNESGPAYIPWDVPRAGRLMNTTTTLTLREKPYHLVAELARGKINQVRNQYAEWLGNGLVTSPEVEELLRRATHEFGECLLDMPTAAADRRGVEAVGLAFDAGSILTRKYEDQVFRLRHQRQPKFDTALGVGISGALPAGLDEAYRLSFNSVRIPLTWRSIEPTESGYQWGEADAAFAWATQRNLRVIAGPLIDFGDGLPDYARRLAHDPVAFKSLMCDYVETAISRYRGKVARWTVSSGANGSSLSGLSEEDLIRLTAMAADAAWQIDANLPLAFGVSQPWGDYLSRPNHEYSPFVYADTLMRAGLPFAGIDLEWFFGSGPRGSYCRDELEATRNLDLFGLLGVPIQVNLAYPSASIPDANAGNEQIAARGSWRGFSPAIQAEWLEAFATAAACKTFVSGVFWDHLLDAAPHRIPNAGLVDAAGKIKPAFDVARLLREAHLR